MFQKIKQNMLKTAAAYLKPYLAPKEEAPVVLEADVTHGRQSINVAQYPAGSAESMLTAQDAQRLLKLSFQRGPESFCIQPASGRPYAMDCGADDCQLSARNMFGMDGVANAIIYTFFAKHGFIGWQLCSMLSQHWLINRACRLPNEDALAPGWTVEWSGEAPEGEDDKSELLRKVVEVSNQKFKLSEAALRFGVNRSIYGQALAYFEIEGEDPATPLNIDGVKPGTFKGINIVEPYWAFPEWNGDGMTPGTSHFYRPQYYTVGGKRIHISRLCVKPFVEVPDILKPSYYFGGIPLTQMIYERVYAAEKTANEVPELALTKRMLVADANIADMMARPDVFGAKANMVWRSRNNRGVYYKNPQETVTQLDTNLADLDDNVWTQYQLVAAVASLPSDRLLGTSPKGFQSTGEYERRTYAQTLKTYQETAYREFVEKGTALTLKSEFDCAAPVSVIFEPIDTPTEAERAATQLQQAQRLSALMNDGIISAEEARENLINDKGGGFSQLSKEPPQEELPDLDGLLGPKREKDPENPQNGGNPAGGAASAKDEWDESKHPRKDNGQFGTGSEAKSNPEDKSNSVKPNQPKPLKEFLGKEYTGVKGRAAVEKLLQEKQGHVKAAFTREDIGDIDLVWGNKNIGLLHIIRRREKQHIDIDKFLSVLPDVIEKGNLTPGKRARLEINYNGKTAVILPEYDGEKIKLVLTAFENLGQKKEPIKPE